MPDGKTKVDLKRLTRCGLGVMGFAEKGLMMGFKGR
jgi:hypothetical protein